MNLVCSVTILINLTTFDWNDHDKKVQKRAVQVCSTDVRYKESPCLKKFVKVGERDYYAICGGSTK